MPPVISSISCTYSSSFKLFGSRYSLGIVSASSLSLRLSSLVVAVIGSWSRNITPPRSCLESARFSARNNERLYSHLQINRTLPQFQETACSKAGHTYESSVLRTVMYRYLNRKIANQRRFSYRHGLSIYRQQGLLSFCQW